VRFFRLPPFVAFTWTARKEMALLRKQRLEREAIPLFAAPVAAEQPTIEAVRASRERGWAASNIQERRQRAAWWRRARRALRALPEAEAATCLASWNAVACSSGPEYFGNHVWQVYRRLGLVQPGHAGYLAEWNTAVETLERLKRLARKGT
jgi:hypothetical protein